VVWNDRLFLTGASRTARRVFCYETATGRLLWQRDVPGTAGEPTVNGETGFASPTPATDGRRVYVAFATGDLAALDFAGNPAWVRALGVPKNPYGHAASLRVHADRLLVQLDQGTAKEGLSRLLALDTATGQTAWEAKRPVPSSWSSPLVANVNGREQAITCGDPWVIAYDLADGRELWRADCLKGDVGPSPVFAGGVVYAAVEYRGTAAVRADGQGDVTKTHVLWSVADGAPDVTSPLAAGPYVFLLTSYGSHLTCLDAKSGDERWQMDVEGSFMASPSAAGRYVYLFDLDGKAFVLEPGAAAGKTVFTTDMGDKITASPAFRGGRIFVRGEKELFCVGKK
jgi:outer membrane protein assembly factor BamB